MARKKLDLSHLPSDAVKRGHNFAELLREAIFRQGINQAQLAANAEIRPGTVTVYLNDGYDKQLDKIRRPDPETIVKFSKATGIDENALRIAAGYTAKEIKGEDVEAIDKNGLTRVLDSDSIEILDAYEGLPQPIRNSVKEHLRSLRLLSGANESYKKRTDIIGKSHDDDGDIERIALDED